MRVFYSVVIYCLLYSDHPLYKQYIVTSRQGDPTTLQFSVEANGQVRGATLPINSKGHNSAVLGMHHQFGQLKEIHHCCLFILSVMYPSYFIFLVITAWSQSFLIVDFKFYSSLLCNANIVPLRIRGRKYRI